MATRQAIREAVVDRLYSDKEIIRGTATGGDASTVVDIALIRGIVEATDLIGAYVWISGGGAAPDEEQSMIIAFDRATGTLTISPDFTDSVVSTDTYEIHYDLRPNKVNNAIVWSVEVGTRNALTGPTSDAGTVTLETNVIVEGALAYCKKAIAGQALSRDPSTPIPVFRRAMLLAEAAEHEVNWLRGLERAGFVPFVSPALDVRKV